MPPITTLPNTLDPTKPTIHRAVSGHYYAVPSSATVAAQLAVLCDFLVTKPSAIEPFAQAMYTANPGLFMGEYDKSIQSDPAVTFPEPWYAHTSTTLSSANRVQVFSKYWEMQADQVTSTYTDGRGISGTTWREYIAKDHWKNVADLNATFPTTNPVNLIYFDSMGQFVGALVNPTTGALYTASQWHQVVYTVGDQGMNRRPSVGMWVFANGLTDGNAYMGTAVLPSAPTGAKADIINHVDVAIAESFLRGNGSSVTVFPSNRTVEQSIDLLKSISALPNKAVWVVLNINNATAGGGGFVPTSTTPTQMQQWRRYAMSIFLIGNDGKAFFEFVESTSLLPWDEDHPYYHVILGAPVDTLANGLAYIDGTTGLYTRKFAQGTVYVNNSGSAVTFNPGVGFKEVDGTAISGTVTIGAHDGRILLGASSGGTGGSGGGTVLNNILTDTFTRTVAAGSIGTADTGQTYTLQGTTTNYLVDGARAVVTTPLATGRRGTASGIAKRDLHALAKFGFSELPIGDNEVFYLWLRIDAAGQNGYRVMCRVTVTNTIEMRLQKVVANASINLGTLRTLTPTFSLGDTLVAEVQASGVSPTVLQGSLYREQDGPPAAWLDSTNDSEATLQVATGGSAWAFYVEALNTNAPLNCYLTQFNVDELVAAPPVNLPPAINSVSPADGTTIPTAAGLTTVPVKFQIDASDTDGVISLVTLSLNGGTPQVIPKVGLLWTVTNNLAVGGYIGIWEVTDDKGAKATAQVNLTISFTPVVVVPPPIVQEPTLTSEFILQFLTHTGAAVGELKGADLRFGRFVGNPGFVSFDLDRAHPMAPILFSEPHKFDWSLQRNGIEILAGEVATRQADTDTNAVSYTGTDWMDYFDQLVLPFDPDNMKDSDNFTMLNADLKDIAEGLIAFVLNKYTHTIKVSMNNAPTGLTQDQHFAASDLNTLKGMLDTLAGLNPGFEWEITHSKQFIMYSPRRSDYNAYRVDSSNVKQIHYGLEGIPGTIIYGRGSGSGSAQAIKKAVVTPAARIYRDRVRIEDFGTVTSKSQLTSLTNKKAGQMAKQRLEFWVTLEVGDVNIWNSVFPGQYLYVDYDDGFIALSGWYRLSGYDGYVDDKGNEQAVLNFNTDDTTAD